MSDPLDSTFAELEGAVQQEALDSAEQIDAFRIRYLSKKQGKITELLKGIPSVAPENRKAYGQRVNALKRTVESRIADAQEALKAAERAAPVDIDLSLPGISRSLGSLHPITQTEREIRRVLESFGFAVAEGPEIEDDWHNFGALNFPPDHPARDMQDTFWLDAPDDAGKGVLLRTHTSPVQIRVMQQNPPPIRIIAPGRVYRNEAISYKSFCLFHQVEGLYVDKGVSLADLKQVLHAFAREIFGDDVRMRFRPSFFPFTEPSAEVDIWWKDDSLPDGGRWMEILGSGMVDPEVLKAVNVDPEEYTGYAFGMGVERIAMLRYNISDIRVLYENDVRFLEQFS
ncbi:MAG: phenylalanine--tRNA ligase subunit alpha [Rhodothermales bacterium]|nr:phenylalanine--tRNA ligase subunit alpha [Rhodothermales bacterium]MBO6780309.1 phenylalanine--tRNA ligase subunit alpha [Rhodothermales bacterium]